METRLFTCLVPVLPFLFLSACGLADKTDNPAASDSRLAQLQGEWESACKEQTFDTFGLLGVKVNIKIEGNVATHTRAFYAPAQTGASCMTLLQSQVTDGATLIIGEAINTANGDDAYRLDITTSSDTIYAIYKLDDALYLWVDDEDKTIEDGNVVRFNELDYDTPLDKL